MLDSNDKQVTRLRVFHNHNNSKHNTIDSATEKIKKIMQNSFKQDMDQKLETSRQKVLIYDHLWTEAEREEDEEQQKHEVFLKSKFSDDEKDVFLSGDPLPELTRVNLEDGQGNQLLFGASHHESNFNIIWHINDI